MRQLIVTILLMSTVTVSTSGQTDSLGYILLFEDVVIFIHHRDRLLLLSSWALGRERLGRSGLKGDIAAFPQLSHISIIDMTGHVKGIQNHTHLNKVWVQQRIRELLKN